MGQGFPNVNSFLLVDSFDTYHVGTISDVFGVSKDGISMNPQYVAFYFSLSMLEKYRFGKPGHLFQVHIWPIDRKLVFE